MTSGAPVRHLPPLVGTIESPTVMTMRDGVRRFTNSEIQTFKTCRRKWYLTYYLRLRQRHESPVGIMQVGNRIHRALQYHYGTQAPGSPEFIDARDALEALIVHDSEVNAERIDSDAELAKRFTQDADLERIMLEGYVDWITETGADARYEIISAETYREVDLHIDVPHVNTVVRLISRLDLRVRRLSDGMSLFLDHKTTGSIDTLVRQLLANEQMLWYILIEKLRDSEHSTQGAVYNMLRRVKRSAKAKPPFYARHTVNHNSRELESFRVRTIGTIADILTLENLLDKGADHRLIAYPTPTSGCSFSCPFYGVCRMFDDGSHVNDYMRDHYVTGDPLDYYVSDK